MLLIAAPLCLDLLGSNVVSNGDELWQHRATLRDKWEHEDSASEQRKRHRYRESEAYHLLPHFKELVRDVNGPEFANSVAPLVSNLVSSRGDKWRLSGTPGDTT